MIRVMHNGEESALDFSRCSCLSELIQACACGDDSRVVTGVKVNGCVIPEEELERLEAFPLEGIEEIELETRLARDVALSSLESSSSYSSAVSEAVVTTASHLRAGRLDDGNRLYAQVTDALRVLLFSISSASRELGEAGQTLRGFEEELQPWLLALVEAQQAGDWLRVADYLEFEVAERVDAWRRRIDEVRRQSASGANGGFSQEAWNAGS